MSDVSDIVYTNFVGVSVSPLLFPSVLANTADIFTKALAPCDHQRFCTLLAFFALLDCEGVDCLTERGELNPYVYDVSALDCFHPVLLAVVFPCVAGNIRKPPPELTLKWISKAWKAVPKELIQRSFLTCGISNALDGSQDNLCMQHRRDVVKGEVELDNEIAANGFCCNNVEEPESDGEANQDGFATVDGDT
ncbi:unnamed protein product [Closterium sp. NIES-53]